MFHSDRFPSSDTDLWVIPLGGEPAARLTKDSSRDESPHWSPDGTTIAFSACRDQNWDIWVMPASGGPQVRVTTDPLIDSSPKWSPDGQQIAFASARTGNLDIWIMTLPPLAAASSTWGAIKCVFR